MLDVILKMVQDNTESSVVQNKKIPNDLNANVQQEIMKAISGGLSQAASSGNSQAILDLFGKGAKNQSLARNPIYKSISSNLSQILVSKFNMNKSTADSIIKSSLPAILSKFSGKVADPKDKSIDMNTVLGSLLGGKTGNTDFNDLLGNLLGGSTNQRPKKGTAKKATTSRKKADTPAGNPLMDVLSKFLKK
ncbi:hypothetical protein [Cecembia sp.]|uniref:hypothetical protein n=1 Tax=Cecembia sp. TaxID=1898110 RepID=UPI0025BFB8EE|nr:hypothetical protein [Cecembia sp.]